MSKGELTTLRCLRIADVLRDQLEGATVEAAPHMNLINITLADGTWIVIRPVSIAPIGKERP